jgi:hypothetical protein
MLLIEIIKYTLWFFIAGNIICLFLPVGEKIHHVLAIAVLGLAYSSYYAWGMF